MNTAISLVFTNPNFCTWPYLRPHMKSPRHPFEYFGLFLYMDDLLCCNQPECSISSTFLRSWEFLAILRQEVLYDFKGFQVCVWAQQARLSGALGLYSWRSRQKMVTVDSSHVFSQQVIFFYRYPVKSSEMETTICDK